MRALRLMTVAGVLAGAAVMATPSFAALHQIPDRTWQIANGKVNAIAVAHGRVYVGGTFTAVKAPRGKSGTRTRLHLAAFSQRTGRLLPWRPRTNRAVYALAVHGKRVYAGGAFTRAGGRAHHYLVAFAAGRRGRVVRWRAQADDNVRTLAMSGTRLFAGGDFRHVNGQHRVRLAAFSLRTGGLLGWSPRANGRVTALAVSLRGRTVYVGGAFRAISHHRGGHLAAVAAVSGGVLRWAHHPTYVVWGLDTGPRRVYVAGGGEGGHISAYTGAGRRVWLHLADGDAQSVSYYRGGVYVAGHFDNFCRTNTGGGTPWRCNDPEKRSKLLSLTSRGALTGWNPGAFGSPIGAWYLVAGAKVEVGGEFTRIGQPGSQVNQQGWAQFSRG
jgi:hypothetical protein